uniref:Putative ovule protein n=1 Tax=Solanum chacoense TaxID=4108 RepID=A0A0V0GMH3_SOLCH
MKHGSQHHRTTLLEQDLFYSLIYCILEFEGDSQRCSNKRAGWMPLTAVVYGWMLYIFEILVH